LCGRDRSGAFHLEDDMIRSATRTLALSALVATGISGGAAQAQTVGGPTVTNPAATGTIAPSMLYGAGPPTGGLDSDPYRNAPKIHKTRATGDKPSQSASAAGGKTRQPARGAKAKGSSTLN
jgi:hypothetical protein